MRAVMASVALIAVLIAGQSAPVYAGGVRSVDNASAQEVVDGMAGKFGRGVANVATGWAEFPKQIYVTWSEDGAGRGLLIGPLKGVGMTLVRTLAGVGEVATFFLAWPGFYDAYLDPPYVWQKE